MHLAKLDQLRSWLLSQQKCIVAYSGGVDSTLLAVLAHEALGVNAKSVIADSPSLPRTELEEALAMAKQFGFDVTVLKTNEFENPSYTVNAPNRCYFCKSELFSELQKMAHTEKFHSILYGENASDNSAFRPGAKAAMEFKILAPLKELGITKSEVRQISKALGLPTTDKPQSPCLSSRIPHGEPVTPSKLKMIETAELALKRLGLKVFRVRHHEIGETTLARLEVDRDELHLLRDNSFASQIDTILQSVGYRYVTLDLKPYRRTDETVPT